MSVPDLTMMSGGLNRLSSGPSMWLDDWPVARACDWTETRFELRTNACHIKRQNACDWDLPDALQTSNFDRARVILDGRTSNFDSFDPSRVVLDDAAVPYRAERV